MDRSEIPQWAKERAAELVNDARTVDPERRPFSARNASPSTNISLFAFAKYVAEHEEPPSDPLLVEARAFAGGRGWNAEPKGESEAPMVIFALAALRRGIELAKARGSHD